MASQRQTAIEFTRGVMDSLREYCGISDEPEFIETPTGFETIVPGSVVEVCYLDVARRRIGIRTKGKKEFAYTAWVNNEKHAKNVLRDFLRGIAT